jgi:hypothetical protein
MSELAETVSEAVEKGQGGSLNTIIAVAVAITATFTALCNVKDGNIGQAMQQAQARTFDQWTNYQAKGTKLNIAEAALDGLLIQRELAAGAAPEIRKVIDERIQANLERIKHLNIAKADAQEQAEAAQKEYDHLNFRDDQFDMAEATTSIAIALFGITALTQKRRLLYVAMAFAGFGVLMGLAGFLGLSLHPDFLARLLS